MQAPEPPFALCLTIILNICLLFLQRKVKYTDARLKALKAKNEYQLCLEASNTTIHKYFVEDLSDLIDVSLLFLLTLLQFSQ